MWMTVDPPSVAMLLRVARNRIHGVKLAKGGPAAHGLLFGAPPAGAARSGVARGFQPEP
ncbi:MAG: hypothetical protein JWL67_2457 [Solirubrobacterales bacterium]|jgi:hypothetical protein|nr:hypothetical protein [Solirubrobacterales bacterium]